MINSAQASILNIPTLSLQKVIFQRKLNRIDDYEDGFTLMQCIEYLQSANLVNDDVCSTHKYYIFQQNLIIKDARFKYKHSQPGIIYLWQKYVPKFDLNNDLF